MKSFQFRKFNYIVLGSDNIETEDKINKICKVSDTLTK